MDDLSLIVTLLSDDHVLVKVVGAVLALMVAAQAIVNLTPTPKDDEVFGKVYKVVEKIAGIWSHKAKQLPGDGKDK